MYIFCGLAIILLQVNPIKLTPTKGYCVFQNTTTLTCRKHLPNKLITNNVTILELHNLDWDLIDLKKLIDKFPNVENITVVGRNICHVLPPPPHNKIKVLQLKYLKISNISYNFLDNLPNLEILNLEGNLLQSLDANFSVGNLKHLQLLDNLWNCSKNLDWILKLNKRVIKSTDDLVCHGEPYNGRPLTEIAKYLQTIKQECPQLCECTLPQVKQKIHSNKLEPRIMVNCSNRGLTQLPQHFPPNTVILHLEGNDIEDLRPIRENRKYRNLEDLYLDNNRIVSIGELEGSYWLTNFRVFSISGNKLTELPTYALDNALQQNLQIQLLTLSGNPWRCDCVFTPAFQTFLQKYTPQIKDVNEVKCSYVEGDENSLLPIKDLSRSSVCRLPTEYSVQEALDLLNAVLGCLIVLILGKLGYDYYHFKKTGKVPWIVTKMP